MTCDEAIEILQEEHDYCQEMSYVIEALKMAIAALEKQIPKKPAEYGEDWFICPICENGITTLYELETHTFCLVCGQALDWSDTE